MRLPRGPVAGGHSPAFDSPDGRRPCAVIGATASLAADGVQSAP